MLQISQNQRHQLVAKSAILIDESCYSLFVFIHKNHFNSTTKPDSA